MNNIIMSPAGVYNVYSLCMPAAISMLYGYHCVCVTECVERETEKCLIGEKKKVSFHSL